MPTRYLFPTLSLSLSLFRPGSPRSYRGRPLVPVDNCCWYRIHYYSITICRGTTCAALMHICRPLVRSSARVHRVVPSVCTHVKNLNTHNEERISLRLRVRYRRPREKNILLSLLVTSLSMIRWNKSEGERNRV